MKKRLVLLVLVVLMTVCAAMAQAAPKIGWKIEFTLNGQTAEVGASDYGSGYAVATQSYTGTHIGVGLLGSLCGIIYNGARSPLAETMTLWNNTTKNCAGILSWRWRNYDRLWNAYIVGLMPADLDIQLSIVSREGRYIHLNPNGGSINLNLVRNGGAGADHRITVSSRSCQSGNQL